MSVKVLTITPAEVSGFFGDIDGTRFEEKSVYKLRTKVVKSSGKWAQPIEIGPPGHKTRRMGVLTEHKSAPSVVIPLKSGEIEASQEFWDFVKDSNANEIDAVLSLKFEKLGPDFFSPTVFHLTTFGASLKKFDEKSAASESPQKTEPSPPKRQIHYECEFIEPGFGPYLYCRFEGCGRKLDRDRIKKQWISKD